MPRGVPQSNYGKRRALRFLLAVDMTTANATTPEETSGVSANDGALLEAVGLKKHFPVTKGLLISKITGHIKAVDGVSFELRPGETLGIVGESGCGKSTTAKMTLMLEEPTEGSILFEGKDIHSADVETRREYRRSVQAVFQDPWSSLNPRMRVRDLIAEPMVINWEMSRAEIQERVLKLLNDVGLSAYHANLYPHEFSGGQRQRLAIARALALNPRSSCWTSRCRRWTYPSAPRL